MQKKYQRRERQRELLNVFRIDNMEYFTDRRKYERFVRIQTGNGYMYVREARNTHNSEISAAGIYIIYNI